MSDAKKTGSRDISELKQRLGLKKKGAAPAGQGGGNGLVAPPGVGLTPPPGVPQAPQPVIPNAADDPFGAMNAMAAVGTVQRAPEIVIVNDGRPVEQVHSGAGSLLKIIAPGLVGIVVGVAVGKIGTGAAQYNAALASQKAMLGDKSTAASVIGLKKQLADLDTLLDEAKTKTQFRPDPALDKQLAAIAQKLEVKDEGKGELSLAQGTSPAVTGQILAFYSGVAEIKAMLDGHVKSATFDDILFKKGKENADEKSLKESENAILAGQPKYGVLMMAPTDNEKSDFGAKVVELAGVYCGGANNPTPRCPEGEAPSAFAYRSEPGGGATKGELVTGGADSVPAKKLVMFLPGAERDALLKGAEPAASEVYYTKRLKAIYERVHGKTGQDGKPVGGLVEDGNKLQSILETEAGKGTRFSFFM